MGADQLQETEDALHQAVVPCYLDDMAAEDNKNIKSILKAAGILYTDLTSQGTTGYAAPQPQFMDVKPLAMAVVKKHNLISPIKQDASNNLSCIRSAQKSSSSSAAISAAVSSAVWLPTPGAWQKEERAMAVRNLTEGGQIPLSFLKSLLI